MIGILQMVLKDYIYIVELDLDYSGCNVSCDGVGFKLEVLIWFRLGLKVACHKRRHTLRLL